MNKRESPIGQIDSWDDGDPWGSAMALSFALCDLEYLCEWGADLEAWGYRPSPMMTPGDEQSLAITLEESYDAEMLFGLRQQGELSNSKVEELGSWLHQVCKDLEATGHSY